MPGQEDHALACLEAVLDDQVAVLVVEPLVQGAGGMVMYEPKALDSLFQAAHRVGALVIADEVLTGFGAHRSPFCFSLPDRTARYDVLIERINWGNDGIGHNYLYKRYL